MSQIVVPSGIKNGRMPTLTEYVETYLTRMRAPLKESTVFTRAGRTVLHGANERIIYGPRGQKIRIVDDVHGTQVEHGNERGRGVEHRHAHVRPPTVTNMIGVFDVEQFTRQRAGSPRTIISRRSTR